MKNLFKKLLLIITLACTFMIGGIIKVSAIELGNEQNLIVKNYADDSDTTIKARFNGSIPYVKLDDLFRLMFNDNITINTVEPGIYEVITNNGKATIDTVRDYLYSSDFSEFITVSSSEDSDDDENAPKIIKEMYYGKKGAATATTIDFTKYNIDLYGENNKIWMPAGTIFNIFMQMGFYDGNILNIIDSNDTDVFTTDEYQGKLQNLFNNKQRFSEYSKQSYDELCFIFDNFYGNPEKSLLSESIKNNGLDYTLKNYNEETKLIRTWLLSNDLVEYYAGLVGLNAALYDGGHTNLIDIFGLDFLTDSYPGLKNNESYELYKDLEFYKNKPTDSWIRMLSVDSARRKILESEKYIEKGDTAMYSFDEFNFNIFGWNYYYENGGEYPNDTLGNILKSLDKASKNPNIKYFVFDISNNTGGLALVAPMIMNYLGFDNMLHEKNIINNQVEEIGFKIDINRDGVYNENDKISKYNFNYGVLTSEFTFSTGNLFAAMARDNGFAILGEMSGGGACNLTTYNTSEGVMYYMSAMSCSLNKNYESVDLGIPVDYDLIEMVNEKKDYTKFYNLDIISNSLNDFYKSKKQEYNVESVLDDGNFISFKDDEGKVYQFDIRDRLLVTDSDLNRIVELMNNPNFTFEKLKTELNKYIDIAKKVAGSDNLLKLYEIYLSENGVEIHEIEGGFKLKLKITDDIKDYDFYKLIYIAEDGTTEEPIILTKNGDYLEGILPHLSMYALVGGKTTTMDSINNPPTKDNIMFYIFVLGLSMTGLVGLYIRKKINDK